MTITHDKILYGIDPVEIRENGSTVLIDPHAPNWMATDERGGSILERFDGRTPFGEVVRAYVAEAKVDWTKGWQHVETIARDALRQKFLVETPREVEAYAGRKAHLAGSELSELWLHTNNSCNLTCSHCLVGSGPDGDRGLPADVLRKVIDEARTLGAKRFYFTGGEPMVRRDFIDLCRHVLADPEAELAVLSNATLIEGRRLEEIRSLDLERFRLQISIDGSGPAVNDPIRGAGSFETIVAGVKAAVGAGIAVTLTSVITAANADDVPRVTRLAGELGAKGHHLLWLHKRGRADGSGPDHTPPVAKVIDVVRACRDVAREVGVVIDNFESIKARLNTPAGIKRDLSNACVESLCVYSDGNVYPSAATANVPELLCGNVLTESLEQVWKHSQVCKTFRAATVEQKEICRDCHLKFLCGGGDLEHSYFYGGSILAHDPYCELHMALFEDAMTALTEERRPLVSNGKSGYDAPVAITWMGENAIHCATGEEEIPEVLTSHSECVLSFDLDAPRKKVREFYGSAAEEPQEDLCCPVRPMQEDLAHIPQDVVERFYGCGSPVADAGIAPGETTLDLGSGAGIDVFIAARRVGPTGRAIGVDMTDEMLRVARANQPVVAANLGYDNVEFHKGVMEQVSLPDKTADLITSNCVINLSPDKQRVFREMWRLLKDHGRIVVADIVSDQIVPPHQRRDPRLWGECISGALTEEEFVAFLERAGFYGVQVLKKVFWKTVEGYDFHSVTVRAYKFEKTEGCVFVGQFATYQGPFKGVSDEEGHHFPRGVPVEVCTDTAAKLTQPPYGGLFIVTEADGSVKPVQCIGANGEPCC